MNEKDTANTTMDDDANIRSGERTAILVLGQSLNKNATPSSILISRLEACAQLQQELQPTCILFTGGDTSQVGVTEAKVMHDHYQGILQQQKQDGNATMPPPEVILEENALTTVWNALFCLPLLRYKKIQKVHLITSDFHMPRSMLIFESVFHHQSSDDIQFVRHAVPIPLPYKTDDGINGMQPSNRYRFEYAIVCDYQHPLEFHVANQAYGFRTGPVSRYRVKECQHELDDLIDAASKG
ncbi:MAG: hypothetical protein SGBAC_008209 [Bacillariaceae sp.]